MKLLQTPKSEYMLNASLEVLHQQSIEWLNDIAFWRDEAAFFYALVVSRTLREIPVKAKDSLKFVEGELIRITGGELDALYREVEMHEYFLDHMLESRREDQADYRAKHAQLTAKFESFEKRFKELKNQIFKLVKLTRRTLIR